MDAHLLTRDKAIFYRDNGVAVTFYYDRSLEALANLIIARKYLPNIIIFLDNPTDEEILELRRIGLENVEGR